MVALMPEYLSPGKQFSFLLHVLLVLLLMYGVPDFMHRKFDPDPIAISVDILPIAPVSNVKPQEKTEIKPDKKPLEDKKTEKKATTQSNQVQEKPKPLPDPIVKTKDAVKIPDKKVEKKIEKKPKDDLESILKSVQETAKAEEAKRPTEKKVVEPSKTEAKSQTYDNSLPLSMNEKDAIRQQLQRCWNIPAGAKDAQNLIVTLHILVGEDGVVNRVELASDQGRYGSDSFFRAAADSAIRSVRECSPLKNLPVEKYGSWRDMELTFNPKDAL